MRFAQQLGMVFFAGVALLAPGLARSQSDPDTASYWLAPYILRGWLTPAEPQSGQPFSLSLRGFFPYDCGVIADTTVRATRIAFTMRVGAVGCDDTARTWTQEFPLGPLPDGLHTLTIVRTFVGEDGAIEVREAPLEIRVGSNPEPPPPPPLPPTSGPLFARLWTVPWPATTREPTTLVLRGFFPYDCGFIGSVRQAAEFHFELRLGRLPYECVPDTTRAWEWATSLGMVSPGRHAVRVSIQVGGIEDSLAVQDFFGEFDVIDDGPPPPPPEPLPPPSDSLLATRPNPFVEQTRFAVMVSQSTNLDVGILDLQGRVVRTLFRGSMPAGTWEFSWDGRRDDGSKTACGVYFYRSVQAGRAQSRRVVLLPRM